MKKIKKLLILLVVVLVLAGAAGGGIYAYQNHQQESLEAEVVYVSDLNWGYYEDEVTSSGYITNDYVQNVYAEDKTIAEVLVEEGDEVSVGDTLFVYDTEDLQMQMDLKKLELQGVENDIALAKKEIEALKKITPVSEKNTSEQKKEDTEKDTEDEDEKEENNSTVILMQPQKKNGDAFNYIDKKAKSYAGKGTTAKPYRFLCTQECYVLGAYLNNLVEKEKVAAFEIWTGNSVEEGTLISCWTFDGTTESKVEEDSKWLVATQEQLEDEVVIEEETEEEEESEEETEEETEEEGYTKEEIKAAIEEEEGTLRELDIEKRELEVVLDQLKKDQEKAAVKATIDGVVKKVGDLESISLDGSSFIEITDSDGFFVTGEISELMLNQIEIGQEIYVNSWSNGEVYCAKIKEISKYPTQNSDMYYGEGNPNVSYYPFTAYIEEAEGLTNGDYVDLSITPISMEEDMDAIYIEKAYVREENGQSYVLKAGADERLVKQYVQTGRTLYGSAIEIKAGLSDEDRIAFPYGKTAKEGVKVIDSTEYY